MPDELEILRREIAERLGWIEREIEGIYFWVDADGKATTGGSLHGAPLPDWPRDLNAAARLLEGCDWVLFCSDGRYYCQVDGGYIATWTNWLPAPAEAICRAFVARKGAQDE